MRLSRQNKILEIIKTNEVETQDQLLNLLRDNIHSGHIVVLGQQNGKGKTDIACTGYSNLLSPNGN